MLLPVKAKLCNWNTFFFLYSSQAIQNLGFDSTPSGHLKPLYRICTSGWNIPKPQETDPFFKSPIHLKSTSIARRHFLALTGNMPTSSYYQRIALKGDLISRNVFWWTSSSLTYSPAWEPCGKLSWVWAPFTNDCTALQCRVTPGLLGL